MTGSAELLEQETETHYIFGLNGIFSFDENGSIFSIVVEDDETRVLHQFQRKNSVEKVEADIGKGAAVEFLSETGYEPFMRLDIQRSIYLDGDKEFAVEEVEQLGTFTDRKDLGGEEVNYAEKLKNEMMSDSERKEELTEQAKCIIRNVKG
jgi:adenylate cyclase class IV